ncbi:hypothetical protein HBI46_052300 [Parastagonospora nodorum]|nr:hypothetical protein HBI95_039120 [Parastagonospora nodorum]KAH5425450.1 hypothetical protein HBI46_052300 [Parastagonospora nodorum]
MDAIKKSVWPCILELTELPAFTSHDSVISITRLSALQPAHPLALVAALEATGVTSSHGRKQAQCEGCTSFAQSLAGSNQSMIVTVRIRPAETQRPTRPGHKALGRTSWMHDNAWKWTEQYQALSSHRVITIASAGRAVNKAISQVKNTGHAIVLAVLICPLEQKRLVIRESPLRQPAVPATTFTTSSLHTRITSALRFLRYLDYNKLTINFEARTTGNNVALGALVFVCALAIEYHASFVPSFTHYFHILDLPYDATLIDTYSRPFPVVLHDDTLHFCRTPGILANGKQFGLTSCADMHRSIAPQQTHDPVHNTCAACYKQRCERPPRRTAHLPASL